MSAKEERRDYDIHGVHLAVWSDVPGVSAAMHRRLQYFETTAGEDPAIRVEFRYCPDDDPVFLRRPEGRSRLLLKSAAPGVAYFPDQDLFFLNNHRGLRVRSQGGEGTVRVFVSETASRQFWRITRPMFTLPFVDQMQRRGRFSLHAAGMAWGGRGLLLAGSSGAGKSTLSLALLRGGFDFLGDDLTFLAGREDRLRMLAFPEAIDLTDETVTMFPELGAALERPPDSGWHKHQVCIENLGVRGPLPEADPALVVFPRVAHAERSRLEPLEKEAAFQELAPNVLLTETAAAQAHLAALGRLVRETPCYRLHTGRDLASLPALIRGVLET